MKTKTGLLALGLFTIAGALTVSCGGSSDGDNTSTAGTTGTSAGTSSGGSGTAGNSSSAGTKASGAGTANAGGVTNNGGNANNAGRNNNTGGFDIGAGGAGIDVPDCPATAMNGKACTPMAGNNACQLDADNYCTCRAQGQADPTWTCVDLGGLGAGGAGPIGGAVTCPATPMNGNTCTGTGLCTGSQCICAVGKVYCAQQ